MSTQASSSMPSIAVVITGWRVPEWNVTIESLDCNQGAVGGEEITKPAPQPTPTPQPAPETETLPSTGASSASLPFAAIGLLGLGIAFEVIGRKRLHLRR
jgi:LPXTG-motif cell wall-anchored protein